jgi:integrase
MVDELMIRWLTVLPWRQRNLRECRIAGSAPNLFRAKVPLYSDIDKPAWLLEAEKKDPNIEVWQFHFSTDETKTGVEIKAILPRPLVPLLEEYLTEYRPLLINDTDPGTLILSGAGTPISINEMTNKITSLTLRHGGKRVNPHLFRDIVAFTWLMDHPRDFLTLSKLLWHSNVNTTLRVYGSRFNSSVAVTAMEAWIEEREKHLARAA